jgi:hypothetical protein
LIGSVSDAFVWLFVSVLGLLLVFMVGRDEGWRKRPARVAYAAVFWSFHFGLTFLGALAPSVLSDRPSWAVDWLFTPEARLAIVEAFVFLACFVIGSEGGYGRQMTPGEVTAAPELAWAGKACSLGGAVLFTRGLYVHGLGVLLEPYERFFTDYSLDFSQAVVLMGFGVLLTLASGCHLGRAWWPGWLLVAGALPVFLVGGRSAPMFVSVALVVLAIQRGTPIRLRWLAVAGVVALSAIAVVRISRAEGLLTITRAAELGAKAPVEGLVELGGSLVPVYAVIDSEARWGREYAYGETYLFPLVRAVERVAGLERTEAETDPRLVAAFINRQYGSIGFSTVAEAYANGGTSGVVLFALAWGALLGRMERSAGSPYGRARLGAVLLPMLFNVRNSFVFVPAWVGLGLAVVAAAYLSRRLTGRATAVTDSRRAAAGAFARSGVWRQRWK